jgi:excisionase family DNA binding protein
MNQHIDYDDLTLLSITKAAKVLKVGKPRIYQMIKNNEIGVIELERSVRIPYAELKKWEEGRIRQPIINQPNELVTKNIQTSPQEIMRGIKKLRTKNE